MPKKNDPTWKRPVSQLGINGFKWLYCNDVITAIHDVTDATSTSMSPTALSVPRWSLFPYFPQEQAPHIRERDDTNSFGRHQWLKQKLWFFRQTHPAAAAQGCWQRSSDPSLLRKTPCSISIGCMPASPMWGWFEYSRPIMCSHAPDRLHPSDVTQTISMHQLFGLQVDLRKV